jgi:hypothetical chaperone protein
VTKINTYLGLDFGTTNTVVSLIDSEGSRHRKSFQSSLGETRNFRSIICYWREYQRGASSLHHNSGPFGILDYLKWGSDQRLIMSMKSYLGDQTFSGTVIHGKRASIEDIIADFLDDLLTKHCPDLDPETTSVTVGRPVVFVGVTANESLALKRLKAALTTVGFANLEFELEPAAAGYQFAKNSQAKGVILVADSGGGTADFSVLRFDGSQTRRFQPIAHTGIGIAGDQFDNRIVNQAVAPMLGKGGTYDSLGKTLPIPWSASDLMWHRLALLNTHENLRHWDTIRKHSHAPETIERLIHLIENNLGFQLARAVATARENLSNDAKTMIDLTAIGFDTNIEITRAAFETWIAEDIAKMRTRVETVLVDAGVTARQIDHVFMTGGTSQTPAVRDMFVGIFGEERITGEGVFNSVADGLAELAFDRT